jgi:hypothetical protein
MRQVPQYLIIGNGRIASHFRHEFNLLDCPFGIAKVLFQHLSILLIKLSNSLTYQ